MNGHNSLLTGVLLLSIAAVLLGGVATATLSGGSVTVTDPANESVQVDADFSGPADLTLTVSQDGTDVRTETISGTAGTSKTAKLDFQGLATGDFSLSINATDESNVTVSEPRMVTTRNAALNVTANETAYVDVFFDATASTNATVELTDSSGSTLNTSTLTFDPVEASDGTGAETLEWQSDADHGEVTVTVETTPAYGYDGMQVSTDGGSLGGVGGFIDSSLGGFSGDLPDWAMALGGIAVMGLVAAVIAKVN
jgi:hypothetical protein